MSAASRPATVALVCLVALVGCWALAPASASALGLGGAGLGGAGLGGGGLGGAGLGGGGLGGAAQTLVSTAGTAGTAVALAAIGVWVLGGAHALLNDTANALSATTSPQLHTTWFSSTYWRMAAIAAVLTLPFLFAAAVQAVIRSDLALLARATFGYLPLATLAIAIAAPLTTLLLAATDQLCGFISSAAGDESAHFLARAGAVIGSLTTATDSPFLACLVGLFVISGAFALWIELLMREAAVYVIVLMLPLAFAAMVWPARRIWAVRAVELLVALILSKFAIVAVLSLGGAAISASAGDQSVAGVMAGAVLILLAAFSPWAMLRFVPMAELASGAAGTMRGEVGRAGAVANDARVLAEEWSEIATAAMRRSAQDLGTDPGTPAQPDSGPADLPDDAAKGPGPDGEGPAGGDGPAPDGGGGGPAPDGGGGGGGPAPAGGGGPSGDEQRPDPVFDGARMPELEFSPEGIRTTPVWPHEDAS
ncbi:MAG: hypothetical protein ACLQA5_15690 [Solirubrobacteraceae bacterium]